MAGRGDVSGENAGGTTTKRLTIAFIGAKSVGKTSIIRVSLPSSTRSCFLLTSKDLYSGHCANM
jgi:hypothetical protein